MSTKIAMRAKLTEHQECTGCHCHAKEGYMIKSDSLTRFVCEECYRELAGEYPLSNFTVSISREELAKLVPEDRKPSFKAGYFLGKCEGDNSNYAVTVTECIESTHPGRGTVDFFSIDDVMTIRKKCRQSGLSLVGIFRTSPSGSPDFNLLDNKTVEDMLFDVVYVVIGAISEAQIAVRDKLHSTDKFGVVIT